MILSETGKKWLGRQDSNLGMPIPKTGALPLGDAPTSRRIYINVFQYATYILRIRASLCEDFRINPLPLRSFEVRCRISLKKIWNSLSFFDKVHLVQPRSPN